MPLGGTVGCTLTRIRRASRTVGSGSESGGSALAVGVADGSTVGEAVVVDGEGAASGVGVGVANGPTQAESSAAPSNPALRGAPRVILGARRKSGLPCGMRDPRSASAARHHGSPWGMVREGGEQRGAARKAAA